MKKLLLLMCVLTTSLLHAMEQPQCWLAKLPLHVQNQIAGYLNDEWQRGWLLHHMKTHQQGRYENPITMWDAKKCKIVFFVDLDLNMKRGLLGINRTLLKLESNRRKNLWSIKDKECFAAHLTATWWRVVFLEWINRGQYGSHQVHVIDLSSNEKALTKEAVSSCPITLGFGNTCIAVSRTKDIAIVSKERFIVLDPDLTIKLDEDLKDMPFQNSTYYHAMDFSPDGSMIGIRSSEAVEFERNGRMLMNEGQKVIRVFDIPAQVPDPTLQEYFARIGVCNELGKKQQEIT